MEQLSSIFWIVCLENKKDSNDVRNVKFDSYDDATHYIKLLSKEQINVSFIEEKITTQRKILFHNL